VAGWNINGRGGGYGHAMQTGGEQVERTPSR
jgi:hypothetical protein